MTKLTRKNLQEIAQSLGAYYCGGNVYNHENITYYIAHKDITKLNDYTNNKNQVYELMEHIAQQTKDLNNYFISTHLIGYSAGIYGNIAQLVKYDIIDNNSNIINTFFTYYC